MGDTKYGSCLKSFKNVLEGSFLASSMDASANFPTCATAPPAGGFLVAFQGVLMP
jgi:hypothetical protein